jgi:hypothetical protein
MASDVGELVKLLSKLMVSYTLQQEKSIVPMLDTAVEIDTELSMSQLKQIIKHIPDSHVMLQTLRQCKLDKNSLERDYGLR